MLTVNIVLNVVSALNVFAAHSCISTLAPYTRNAHLPQSPPSAAEAVNTSPLTAVF
jgi:hypothetical protein